MVTARGLSRLGRATIFAWSRGDSRRANVVLERLSADGSLREIASRHGVPFNTVRLWCDDFARCWRDLCRLEQIDPRELVHAPEGDGVGVGHDLAERAVV